MKDKTIILIWAIFITLAFAAMNMEYAKLEKENAELKERCSILDKSLITSTKNNIERQKIIDEIKEQLTKAEEIILKLSTCLEGHSNNNFEYNLLQEVINKLDCSESELYYQEGFRFGVLLGLDIAGILKNE